MAQFFIARVTEPCMHWKSFSPSDERHLATNFSNSMKNLGESAPKQGSGVDRAKRRRGLGKISWGEREKMVTFVV
ncbi:hypothetical protein CCACVL1_05873 [Corchorus capsularis]|uniref:Uncharacterized protein n=1 Tax=Corchorus capsularis TaxID=210143 RepID=A0A1R3JIM9_COCAP|nr:hypothetical protein CCACVL1_05873 [Corchorus capsularis]